MIVHNEFAKILCQVIANLLAIIFILANYKGFYIIIILTDLILIYGQTELLKRLK